MLQRSATLEGGFQRLGAQRQMHTFLTRPAFENVQQFVGMLQHFIAQLRVVLVGQPQQTGKCRAYPRL